jgi:putative membrane protein
MRRREEEAAMASDAPNPHAASALDDASVQLSSNRTAMSFERTAMSSDRTLMSVVRTSLSLIAFGFTIYQFFLSVSQELGRPTPIAPQRFALILLALGMLLLALGIGNHLRETRARRHRRAVLCERQLIRHLEPVKVSSAMLVAILLLLVALIAVLRVAFRLGPL